MHKVARNNGAHFSLAGYGRLTIRAQHDRKLMLVLGQRGDIPRQHFLKLLESASASVRAKLEAANPRAAAAIRDAIDDVATAIQHEVRAASPEHAAAARNAYFRFRTAPRGGGQCSRPRPHAGIRKSGGRAVETRQFPASIWSNARCSTSTRI